MDKLFHEREPNQVQYENLHFDEIRRLAEYLETKCRTLSPNTYNKVELIQLCKAYYAFLRLCPRMRFAKRVDENFMLTEFEDDDLKLVVPIFKKNRNSRHTTDDKNPSQETAEGQQDSGSDSSDSDD